MPRLLIHKSPNLVIGEDLMHTLFDEVLVNDLMHFFDANVVLVQVLIKSIFNGFTES